MIARFIGAAIVMMVALIYLTLELGSVPKQNQTETRRQSVDKTEEH